MAKHPYSVNLIFSLQRIEFLKQFQKTDRCVEADPKLVYRNYDMNRVFSLWFTRNFHADTTEFSAPSPHK